MRPAPARQRGARLSPGAARTFYNVADALIPPGGAAGVGAGDLDLVCGLEARLARWSRLRAMGLVALLALIECQPLLGLRGRRFSWLPRGERAARLRAWEHSRLRPRRAAFAGLADLIRDLFRRQLEEGSPQSLDGA